MNDAHAGSLGSVIRKRRLELGLTQEQLAKQISSPDEFVRQSEVSRLESGRVGLPRRARLERIAVALDLPIGELLARSGWNGADTCIVTVVEHEVAAPAALPTLVVEAHDSPTPVLTNQRRSKVTAAIDVRSVDRSQRPDRSGFRDAVQQLHEQRDRLELERNRAISEQTTNLMAARGTSDDITPSPRSKGNELSG